MGDGRTDGHNSVSPSPSPPASRMATKKNIAAKGASIVEIEVESRQLHIPKFHPRFDPNLTPAVSVDSAGGYRG